jgi:hypothetical protein
MDEEGIMALPQGAAMQGQAAQPSVTSMQAYDAAQTAMGMTDPEGLAALTESLRQNLAGIELSPSELADMIELFEYLSQRPAEYPALRQQLIDQDMVDAEDLPEDYDPEFLGAMLAALNELQIMQGQGAQAPMQDMDPMAGMGGMAPMAMAEGGLADVASYLASQGRNGDTMLAHITPEEAQLLRARGGSGTINPVTGLPEFFLKKLGKSIKKAVKSVGKAIKKVAQSDIGRIILTVGLAVALGPAGVGLSMGTAAGLASAGVTLAGGGTVKQALVAGAMGYIGGGGTVMGYNPVSAVGGFLPGAAGSALNTGLATGVIGAGVGKLSGMSTNEALRMGLTSGLVAGAGQAYQNYNAAAGAPTAGQTGAAPTAAGDQPFQLQSAGAGADGAIPAGVTPTGIDAVGPTGTAQDYLGGVRVPQSATMQFDPATSSMVPNYSLAPDVPASSFGVQAPANFNLAPELGFTPPPVPVGLNAAQTFTPKTSFEPVSYETRPDVSGLGGGEARVGTPQGGVTFDRPAITQADFSTTAGGTALDTNYGLAPRPVAPVEPPSFFDQALNKGEQLYDKYLSPSRPGLPADAGMIRQYAPLAAVGTLGAAALGAFKQEPGDDAPLYDPAYTGMDYMRDNPDQFRGGLDTSYRRPTSPSSSVVPPTSFSPAIPLGGTAPVYMGGGITNTPGGVSQPYNMAGMYGVPLIYRAKGGEMTRTQFPRKTGPINGPGTGTSDDIPAMLSDGEFVFTAKAVRNAGKGSRRKGAARMYKLMKMLEGGPVKGK